MLICIRYRGYAFATKWGDMNIPVGKKMHENIKKDRLGEKYRRQIKK
jgi:hypothetical protein